ncbi:hypothetical protein RCIROH_96 [Rhodobacter phage RcIroh]|nr:hypothetical protein RCIROH_96 [Rhodobacter phage RcIroh]
MIGRASLDRGAAVPVSAVALGPICGAALGPICGAAPPCPSRAPCCPAMPFPCPVLPRHALPVHRDAPRNPKTAPPGCKGNRLERAKIGRAAPLDSQ